MNEKHMNCGMVSVVGRANVGKSTLINAIMEEKVSIVSPVAQTTRNVIRGILTEPRGQIVFLDTPGVHKAESDLGRLMNKMARTSIEGVDMVLLLLDSSVIPRVEDEGWMRRLLFEEVPVIFLLNKEDRKYAEQETPACGQGPIELCQQRDRIHQQRGWGHKIPNCGGGRTGGRNIARASEYEST